MKRTAQLAFITCLFLSVPVAERAQTPSPNPATATPQAKAGDVDTVEHILNAVYDTISGPVGPRNWDRFRSLYYNDARMIPSHRGDSGKVTASSLTVEQYIEKAQAFFDKEGFFEAPVANRIEVWDHIAHVWSTYESRHAKGEKPFARGINSFQLLNDGNRWWVVTIYWEGEEPGHPLPQKYLSQ